MTIPPFGKGRSGGILESYFLNKKRKDDLNYIAFLLSFDLRDYPLNIKDLSPSVPNPEQ